MGQLLKVSSGGVMPREKFGSTLGRSERSI